MTGESRGPAIRVESTKRLLVIALLAVLPLVVFASCSGSAASRGTPSLNDIPYSAKGCFPPIADNLLRVEVLADGTLSAYCLEVKRSQRLEVVNATNDFPQYAKSLTLSLAGFPSIQVAPGSTAMFPGKLGSHLRKGSNLLQIPTFSDTIELWHTN